MDNVPSIDLGTFIEIVKKQLEEKNYRPIFGLGKGGIGKTESLEYLAKEELKIGYVDIRLLLYSETDLKGIPYPDEHHIMTIWLQNKILPTEKDGKEGILVFDEITSCGRSVRTAAYQLLNERRLGEYVLPDGWLVVCLGNGENDGGDFNGIEGNFGNRCSIYNISPNVNVWKQYALQRGVNELVIAYVTWKPDHLHTYNPDNETDVLFASPRSWVGVSDILNNNSFSAGADSNDIKNNIVKCRILGNIGTTVGNQFLAFCKFKDQMIDPADIVFNGAQPKISMEEATYITIQSCVKLIKDRLFNESQLGNTFSDQTVNCVANFFKWVLNTLSLEVAIMGIKDLIASDGKSIQKILLNPQYKFMERCPEYSNFIHTHKELFHN